jgi:hypothetical protein
VPPIETGPLSLSELLDRMFAIYRRYFLKLIGTTLLPYLLIIPAGAIVGVGIYSAIRSGPTGLIGLGTSVAAVFLFLAVYLAAACLSWIAVTAAVWEIQSGREPTIRASYRAAWRQLWKALLAGFLFAMIVGVGTLLFIAPGVYLALALSLIGPVILAEGAGPIVAFSRSWELTKGYKGKVFVIWLICVGITYVMTYALQIPLLIVGAFIIKGGSDAIWFTVLSGLCSLIGTILPAPLQAIGLCLVYYDSRVRKEGFDLQRMIDSLAPPPPPPPAPATS